MIKKICELTGLNLSYKTINNDKVFSFDVMEYILNDENGKEYLCAIAFLDSDKEAVRNIYEHVAEKFGYQSAYCFELESLLLFVCIKNCELNITNVELPKQCPIFSHSRGTNNNLINFSLNKYELLFTNNDNYVITIDYNGSKQAIPLTIINNKAKIGTWNSFICRSHFLFLIKYIFENFCKVKEIEYDNVLFDPIVDKKRWRHNDFYLPLANSVDELKSKISAKSRHNIKREKRIIEETFSNLRLEDIDVRNNFPEEIVDVFYKYKCLTHNITQNQYDITKRNVTNVYLLKTGENDIRGVALSCEQGDVVFIENHTFDSSLKQYSFGQVLYDMYLDALICKGKKGLSLAGGDLSYKKRYGSICFIAYSGSIKKNTLPLIKHMMNTNWNYNDLYSKIFFVLHKK